MNKEPWRGNWSAHSIGSSPLISFYGEQGAGLSK
jgi:hypothetical protein